MGWIHHCGEWVDSTEKSVSVHNRAYLYGDGCFESIRVLNGKVLFPDLHFTRASKTIEALGMFLPQQMDGHFFAKTLHSLAERNEIREGGRIRATFFRTGAGHYMPEVNEAGWIFTVVPMADNTFVLNNIGLSVDIYPKMKKEINFLANFKTLNCQLVVMAALQARNQGLSDSLILNAAGGVIETTNSNLFVVSNRVLYTPGTDQGCVAGVMRMLIINLALKVGLKVYECNISPQHLLAADELFCTNAISGIKWIGAYRTKRYSHDLSSLLIEHLNEECRV